MELTYEDKIWNRACLDDKGFEPGRGDKALASLLYFDGLVNNGGLGHGFDVCSDEEIRDAIEGFRYFGLTEVAEFLVVAEKYTEAAQERLSRKYYKFSEVISAAFEEHHRGNPEVYAPISD